MLNQLVLNIQRKTVLQNYPKTLSVVEQVIPSWMPQFQVLLLLQTGSTFHFCFCSPESSVAPDDIPLWWRKKGGKGKHDIEILFVTMTDTKIFLSILGAVMPLQLLILMFSNSLLVYLVTCPNFEATFDKVDHIFILEEKDITIKYCAFILHITGT